MAITALVLVLIPGCPVVSLVGAFVGLAALKRIQASAGGLGGRRLAMGAIIAGWLLGIIWTVVWFQFFSALETNLRDSMQAHIQRVIEPEADAASVWVSGLAAPDDAEIAGFRTAFASRFGALSRVSITSLESARGTERASEGDFSLAMVLFCDDGKPLAAARFDLPLGSVEPRLRSLRIIDKARGDLVIPASAMDASDDEVNEADEVDADTSRDDSGDAALDGGG
jgi:hypothetical protein